MKQSVTITGENLNVVVNHSEEHTYSSVRLSKAEMRIATLKAKGIDTSMYFPLGNDKVVKIENGTAVQVDLCDETEKAIVEGGYINHYSLFRRWVMSQMFRMLREMEKDGKNFTEVLQRKGYEYQWKMLENELCAQVKMHNHGDVENFTARNRWFNAKVAHLMAEDYIKSLNEYIEKNLKYKKGHELLPGKKYKHYCKGNPYIRFCGKNIFVEDIDSKILRPLRSLSCEMNINYEEKNIQRLYLAVRKFNRTRRKMNSCVKQSKAFIDAYKASGAYFTMRNLIMFHGARFTRMTEKRSLAFLEKQAIGYKDSGWQLLGVLKQLIDVSGISLQGKIDEWKK